MFYSKFTIIIIIIIKYLPIPTYQNLLRNNTYRVLAEKTDNATCRLCKGADETAEQILCTCDAISLKRLLYLGKANLTPEEVVSVAPRQVLNSTEV